MFRYINEKCHQLLAINTKNIRHNHDYKKFWFITYACIVYIV